MKYFILTFIFLILISSANGNITTFKNEYFIGETFQAELKFPDIVDKIELSNIKILNNLNEPTNIGVILKDIDKENYFVYFDIPEIENGLYKLTVNNVKYIENNILKKENFEKEILISKKDYDIISINPPVIIADIDEKSFFKIKLENKGNNLIFLEITDNSNSTNLITKNISINKESIDYVYFAINKSINKVNLSLIYNKNIFTLPIYVKNIRQKENIKFFIENNNEKKYIKDFKAEIPYGNYAETDIFLENNENNLANLTISIKGNIKDMIKLGFEKIDFFENKKVIALNLYINKAKIGLYEGDLKIFNEKIEVNLPLSIKIIGLKNKVIEEIEKTTNISETVKEENEKIDKEIKPITNKKVNKERLSYMLIIAVIIIFIILYVIIFRKAQKSRPKEISDIFR